MRTAFWMAILLGASCGVGAQDVPQPPPPSPFAGAEARKDARPGCAELSDGAKLVGAIYLTRDQKLDFYDPQAKKRLQFDLSEILFIEQRVVTERMEREWRWKENANDEKVYTGKSYPMREYTTVLHLADGRELTGDCVALIYLKDKDGEKKLILHKRDKGTTDQTLKDLIYVKLVDFRPAPKTQ